MQPKTPAYFGGFSLTKAIIQKYLNESSWQIIASLLKYFQVQTTLKNVQQIFRHEWVNKQYNVYKVSKILSSDNEIVQYESTCLNKKGIFVLKE